MFRRRRPLLRAGMLAGTAYAAHQAGERSLERRYAEADQDQRIAYLETRGAAPATAPPASLAWSASSPSSTACSMPGR